MGFGRWQEWGCGGREQEQEQFHCAERERKQDGVNKGIRIWYFVFHEWGLRITKENQVCVH